jgi:hypothetical protein
VPWPFSYNLTSAVGPDFLVECLPTGQVYLPCIDVIITSFGSGFITIEASLHSRVSDWSGPAGMEGSNTSGDSQA